MLKFRAPSLSDSWKNENVLRQLVFLHPIDAMDKLAVDALGILAAAKPMHRSRLPHLPNQFEDPDAICHSGQMSGRRAPAERKLAFAGDDDKDKDKDKEKMSVADMIKKFDASPSAITGAKGEKFTFEAEIIGHYTDNKKVLYKVKTDPSTIRIAIHLPKPYLNNDKLVVTGTVEIRDLGFARQTHRIRPGHRR